MKLKTMVRIAVLSAGAAVVMQIGTRLPLLPPFLTYDPSEVFVLMGAMTMGPIAGVLIELLKNLLHMLIAGTDLVGHTANFTAGAVLAVTVGALYRPEAGPVRKWLALLAGCVAMAAVMIPANYYIFLPAHGMTGPEALHVTLTGLTPFNFFKALISSLIAYPVVWRIGAWLRTAPARGW